MLLSTNQELRLHIPSNAVDDVTLLSGIIDNSEKDFLREKLGTALYDRLCAFYKSVDPLNFYESVVDGTYIQNPWAELLLNAQRMVCNDALARFAYQQVISVNGAGINVVSGNDYGNADDRLLDKGVGGYKKEAAIACNNLLILLEDWSKPFTTPMPIGDELDEEPDAPADVPSVDAREAITDIVTLWHESKYYYYHADLLIPTASVLQHYLDIYENRDRFIRLLPDLRFIQDEYIEDAFGEDFVREMLTASKSEGGVSTPSPSTTRLLRKVRRLITAYLEQRTQVLTIDKARRQQARDEAISLREQIFAVLKAKEESEKSKEGVTSSSNGTQGYKNNQPNSRIYVTQLI